MAETPLNTTTNSGTQSTTQTPQSATGTNSGGAQSSNVQPGTAHSLLTSNEGVVLRSPALTTITLGTGTGRTVAESRSTSLPRLPTDNSLNPVLISLAVVFCLVALVMVWLTSRSTKNTTDYS